MATVSAPAASRDIPRHLDVRTWTPTPRVGGRAVVLGGGGATGIGWEAGIVQGLLDEGIDLREADTLIGTSAGSVVAAHARFGTDFEHGFEPIYTGEHQVPNGTFRAVDTLRFVVANLLPTGQAKRRALLGRASVRSARKGHLAPEEDWVAAIGERLVGQPWPAGDLLITAVDALTGTSVVFDRHSGVPLERAMAASCAVPGIYPPVTINGRPFVDGGVRTVTNVDLAAGHERVVVIAPVPFAVRRSDRPQEQAAALGDQVRSIVVHPDPAALRAMGRDVLDLTRARAAAEAGRRQGVASADKVRVVWDGA
ncbi:MAG: patatin-like phospholipase family protein [Nostocoides sp.]